MRAYDPHKAYVALIAKGFNEQQADAIIDIVTDATDQYVTKEYLDAALDARFAKQHAAQLQLFVTIVLGQMIALIGIMITLIKYVKGG